MKELFTEMDRIAAPTEAERMEHRTGFQGKLNDHLDDIAVPTLVTVGAHDEPLLISAADYLADRLSDQPAVIIDNAAHLPSLEQPEAFNSVLSGFLASL